MLHVFDGRVSYVWSVGFKFAQLIPFGLLFDTFCNWLWGKLRWFKCSLKEIEIIVCCCYCCCLQCMWDTRWRSWLRHCATFRKVAGLIPDGVTGVDSASYRNEYQGCFLHVPIILKSGCLNLLEPLGPVQACNGIGLPFYFLRYECVTICKRKADNAKIKCDWTQHIKKCFVKLSGITFSSANI